MANKRIYELAEDATPAAADFLMTDISGAAAALKVNLNKFILASGAVVGAVSQAQAFTNGLVAPSVKPAADSVTALQLQNAAGTSVLNVDTTNARVGVGTTGPGQTLEVRDTSGNQVKVSYDSSYYTIYGHNQIDTYLNPLGFYMNGVAKMALSTTGGLSLGDTAYTSVNPGAGAMIIQGNVGIGTAVATNLLSLGGNAARIIWTERHLTADTAGNNLTLRVGGATAGATDKNGGNLILQSGTPTGSGYSSVLINAVAAGASGTTDRNATTYFEAGNAKIGFFAATTVVKQTGYAVPTDLTTCISALTALRTALINYGLMTTV